MVNEIGRILAALVLILARAVGRVYQGFRFLVRRAAHTRSAAKVVAPRGGRLLDIAALSVAADLLIVAEWWRRDTGSLAVPALIGAAVGVAGAAAVGFVLRGPIVRYALIGTEALRLAAAFAFAFSAPTIVTGGTSDPALGAVAIGGLTALAPIERALWMIAAGGRIRDALRYLGFLLPPTLVLALIALILGGLAAPVLAQTALLLAMCLAFVITTPAPRPSTVKQPRARPVSTPPKASGADAPAQVRAQAPSQRPDTDATEGGYHLYKPNSLQQPPEST